MFNYIKKMNRFISIVTIFVLLTSCVYNRSTIYPNKDVEIGMSKNDIIRKYGKPFKEELSKGDNGITEILCYKENLYVGAYEYILSTYFYFHNSKLIKKDQKEESPPYQTEIKSEKK